MRMKEISRGCPPRNLPPDLVSLLDPDDCIHAARVCAQCDNEYYLGYWEFYEREMLKNEMHSLR